MGQELFLKNKINRQIKQNGSTYNFNHFGVDEYGQRSDEVQETFIVKGIFHETVNHVSIAEADGARVVDVPKTYILCLFEDGEPIDIDDRVEINEKVYRVTGKLNVGNFNVAFDISLEMEINESQN